MLKLTIQGLGPVPSFKNTKQIVWNKRTRRPMIITDPKKKRWMDAACHSFESQLRILFPITEGETHGEWLKRLQTACVLPQDDCWEQMLPGEQGVELVPKGQEGCIVALERIK